MKRGFIFLIAIIIFLFSFAGSVFSRSKFSINYSDVKNTVENKAVFNTRDTTNISDPIRGWPFQYGVNQTGKIIATFDCFGTFGWGFLEYRLGFQSAKEGRYAAWPYPYSFRTPIQNPYDPYAENGEYLYGGAIWVGGIVNGDTLVSVGASGWSQNYEMWPPGEDYPDGTVNKYKYATDFSMSALFYDTLSDNQFVNDDPYDGLVHHPLNLRISNRSHVWRSDPNNETIIYDMVISNIGNDYIEQGYVGFFFDCDVSHMGNDYSDGALDDLAGSIRDEGIAYTIDNDGDPRNGNYDPDTSVTKIFAFKFLETSFNATDTSFNWWVPRPEYALDFGPRMRGTPEDLFRNFDYLNTSTDSTCTDSTCLLGTPVGDRNKYYMLSHNEWDYDQIFTASISSDDSIWLEPTSFAKGLSTGTDTRFLMSIGPFDLPPDSSIRIFYATFTGDSVHVDPGNINNLPDSASKYLSNLNFSDVLYNATISDSLIDTLLNPENPIAGLRAISENGNSALIEWDPWVYDDVEGYEIYLYEIPSDSFPYGKILPPWLNITGYNYLTSLGLEYNYEINSLDSSGIYAAFVAQRSGGLVGEIDNPVYLNDELQIPAPIPEQGYVFAYEGDPAILRWNEPIGVDVDYYNIYKIDNIDSLSAQRYYPFYDTHRQYWPVYLPDTTIWVETKLPVDSFIVDEQLYYYFAMEPYAHIDSQFTEYYDYSAIDGEIYIITAVNKDGRESVFSEGIEFSNIETKSRDILFIWPDRYSNDYAYFEIRSFYDSILQGYDYDIYNWRDSTRFPACTSSNLYDCVDWHDFTPYKMVIIDGGLYEYGIADYEGYTQGLTKYLESGGRLSYFSGLIDFNNIPFPDTTLTSYPISNTFLNRFFGIDSVFIPWSRYYSAVNYPQPPPYVDSLFGFIHADSVYGCYPDISYDTLRYPFNSTLQNLWPANTAPTVATFSVNEDGQTTHLFRSRYPSTSVNEGDAVGVKSEINGIITYLFGFHLWYMEYEPAKQLVNCMLEEPPNIVCPDDTLDIYICALGEEVCIDLPIGGATNVAPNIGLWNNHTLCFNADYAGDYSVNVIANNDYGDISCDFNVRVIQSAPIEISTENLTYSLIEGTADLPDSQLVLISSLCDPGSLNWNITIIDDGGWLEINKTSGSNPDSIIVSIKDSSYSSGVYSSLLRIEDPQAYNSPLYISVSFIVESGVDIGDYFAQPGASFNIPINLHTNRPLLGFTIPLRFHTNQPDEITLDSVTVDTAVVGPLGDAVIVDDSTIIARRPIQEPPLPDSLGIHEVGRMYFTASPQAISEVINIDTLTIDYERAIYSYQFIDTDTNIYVPEFNRGVIIIGDPASIAGNILYYDLLTPIPDVGLNLTVWPDGRFEYYDLSYDDYTLIPIKENNDPGASVADIIKMRRLLAQIEAFDTPYKCIAGDINDDCRISVADIIKLRRYLAHLEDMAAGNWKFIDASYIMACDGFCTDLTDFCPFPESLNVSFSGIPLPHNDFVGIRVGDVNGTWTPTALPSTKVFAQSESPIGIVIQKVDGQPGNSITVPVTMTTKNPIAGMELHLKYDSKQLAYSGINSNLPGDVTYNGTDGAIHIIWEDIVNPINVSKEEAIIYLHFGICDTVSEEALVTVSRIEIANPEGLTYDVKAVNGGVTFKGKEDALIPRDFSLRQNYPNPFNPSTVIELALPVASDYELEVYNIIGRLVRHFSGRGEPGVVRIKWDGQNDFGKKVASGIYLYRAKAGSFTATKKMVLLK